MCQGIAATHLRFESDFDSHAHRHWSEIRTLIEKSSLTPAEKARAIAIFSALAQAEAKIHSIADRRLCTSTSWAPSIRYATSSGLPSR
jgi:uncharacterized protein (DUF111 family)